MAGRLCITVMEGGWFQVGEAIVRIDDVRGSRVDVVVEAPKHVKVLRDKVVERIRNGQTKVRRVQPDNK